MQSKSISRIREQAAKMRHIVDHSDGDLASTPVAQSSWSVAAHFDHTIKVAHSILYLLAKAEVPATPRGINIVGRLVLAFGWIPRGRGKSPEKLQGMQASADELRAQLSELDAVIERVAAKPANASSAPIVRHPRFGGLTYAQALRFVALHTEHHLKIVGLPRR